tara:strand:- start:917 stop:1282 length:366 start_codon:yes stop_codon:yes gene_type:complete
MIEKLNTVSSSLGTMIDKNQLNTFSSENISLRKKLLEDVQSKFVKSNDVTSFPKRMTNALNSVAKAQNEAASKTRNFELGLENDLTNVMLNQQVSSLGFQLTLNIRNKVLSAYKDIMNMPV